MLLATRFQILNEVVYILYSANTFRKGIYLFIYHAFLGTSSFYYHLISSLKNNTIRIIIQYPCPDKILLNNSSDIFQKSSLNYFFNIVSEIIQFSLEIFTLLSFLNWLGSLFQKYMTLLAKISYLILEIYLDSKFTFRREYWKLVIPLIIFNVSVRLPPIILFSVVSNPISPNF